MSDNIHITIIDREDNINELNLPEDLGLNLMELCKAYELPVQGTCGGMALCSTCHVYVESNTDLPSPTEDEEIMLDQTVNYRPNSRLGCQIKLNRSADGLVARLAPVPT